ncbi:MAG: PQQ-binding-like beta-propeller repeat protein [Alphaproteobacteria bacterium]|nr:PQQ-binding-like beta-propeller repeat protein [Alphaproteobacteria bacterium]
MHPDRRALLLVLVLAGAGWRGDGTARAPAADPPLTLDPAAATWSTPLPGWGNASPVRLGDLVCTTAEPTHVVCADAARGAVRWQATNDRLDTVPAAERPAMQARLAEGADLGAKVRAGLSELSRLQRETRRHPDDASLPAQVAAKSAEVDRLQAEQDALRSWLTPPELDLIGYASATPATDGQRLYAMTGNGVVSAFAPDGRRLWARWLGEPVRPMKGFDYGSVTSPQLADGVLVVGHRHLRGLDPATGAVRWEDAATWNHYGTPAVIDLGGLVLLALPDGRLLRARDGVQVAEGLGDISYTGPVADGDRVWWVGGHGHRGDPSTNRATGWRLARSGDGVTPTRLFDTALPKADRVYASPIVVGERLFVLTLDNTLSVLDAGTGATRGQVDLMPALTATGFAKPVGYANPTLAGSHLFLGWEEGLVAAVTVADTPAVAAVSVLGESARATPWFEGRTVWGRTLTKLWRWR